jgi:putative aminopeptidase FrvX
MRSADNHSVTAVALVLAKWLSESQPEADVSFIFTKLEEVKQVSATLIARRNGTPFGNFDQCTHIIVLEAPSVGQTEGSKNIFDTRPSYDAGLIIRISDNDLIYVIDRQPNLAESLALHAADSSQISYQHAPLISNCNATAYTLFGQCPNVISLAVPCRNKHNFDPEGQFVLEMVSITDLSDLLNILQSLVISAQKPIDLHPARIIDPDRRHRGNHTKQLRNKRKDWLRTALAAEPKLRAERLFPESLVERTRFIYTSVRARLVNRP